MTLRLALATLLLAAAAGVAGAPPAPAYRLDPAGSSLTFTFTQAGARSSGRFAKLDVRLTLPAEGGPAGRLEVDVDVASLDTRDRERDELLRGADLFDVQRHPAATFRAATLTRTGTDTYEASGTLTIRGVSHEARIPFTFRERAAPGGRTGEMRGELTLRRLDFGVGQGEWRSTEWVGDEVHIAFDLRLVPAER